MIMCNKLNAKHRMKGIFLQNTFQLNKKIKFSGVYNARCPLKSVCMTMTPNHNPVIFSPSTHILDYVGINNSTCKVLFWIQDFY